MEGVDVAFRSSGEQVAEAPDHVGVREMGTGGVEGNTAKSAAVAEGKVAIECEGGLNLGAPIRMTIGPGGKDERDVAGNQRGA